MNRKIFLARPRLDCSFKLGQVPAEEGPPRTENLSRFGRFIDDIAAYHRACGDTVAFEKRPLWEFDLEKMQHISKEHDVVYFPHRTRSQFPIGRNALYYKTAALLDHYTIDPAGWGASLSFLPPKPVPGGRNVDIATLRQSLSDNRSIFEQPPRGIPPANEPYLLFLCQLPHDETIVLHSDVTVLQALDAVIRYAELSGSLLVVKGHPANPPKMAPLRQRTDASASTLWVEDHSIHSCLEGASHVFMVNSGSGIETILHDRTLFRFGRAEYDSVVPLLEPTPEAIAAAIHHKHDPAAYVDFITTFAQNCVDLRDPASFGPIIERAISQLTLPKLAPSLSSSHQHVITSGLPGSGASLIHLLLRNEKFPNVKSADEFRKANSISSNKNVLSCHPADVFDTDALIREIGENGRRASFILPVRDPRSALLLRSPMFPAHRSLEADHGLEFGDASVSLTAPGVATHGLAVQSLLERDDIGTLLLRYEDLIANPDLARERIARLTGWSSHRLLANNPLFAPIANAPAWTPPSGGDAARLIRQFRWMPALAELVVAWGYAPDNRWLDELALSAPEAASPARGTIVAFHTDDDLYATEAARMLASAERFGLKVDITVVPKGADWLANVRMKPHILQEARKRLSGPILYVDVDAYYHADPWARLDLVETDIAFATYRDGRARSGTVYIADSSGARRFLEDWIERLDADPAAWDQFALDPILEGYRAGDCTYSVSLLPLSLCHIFDRGLVSDPVMPPIIEHLQASREWKEPSQRLDRRRQRLAEIAEQTVNPD